jgi:hypothetical protein
MCVRDKKRGREVGGTRERYREKRKEREKREGEEGTKEMEKG